MYQADVKIHSMTFKEIHSFKLNYYIRVRHYIKVRARDVQEGDGQRGLGVSSVATENGRRHSASGERVYVDSCKASQTAQSHEERRCGQGEG